VNVEAHEHRDHTGISLFMTSVGFFLLQVGINAEDSRYGTFGNAPNTSANFEDTEASFNATLTFLNIIM